MGFFDKMKDIVNPKDIDEGYEDDEYVFDDNGAADYGTSYDNAYNGSQATNYAPVPPDRFFLKRRSGQRTRAETAALSSSR